MDNTILVFLGLIMIMLIGIFALLYALINDKKESNRAELSLPDWNRRTPITFGRPTYISYRDYMNDPQTKRKTPNQIRMDFGFPPIIDESDALPGLSKKIIKAEAEAACWRKLYNQMNEINQQTKEECRELRLHKKLYDNYLALPNCNDCERENCQFKPGPCDVMRLNCPLYLKVPLTPSVEKAPGTTFIKEN